MAVDSNEGRFDSSEDLSEVSFGISKTKVAPAAVEMVQGFPSRPVDTSRQSAIATSSVESTQICADQLDLGTGCDVLGSVGDDIGTSRIELRAKPTEIDTEDEEFSIESEPSHGNDDHDSTLAVANLTDYFQIVRPPNTRGRPKQKPWAVKARQNQAVAMSEPTYKASHEKLLQLKRARLYQAKKSGTLEVQLALEIAGIRVLAYSTVALMRKCQTSVKPIKKIKIAYADLLDLAAKESHTDDPATICLVRIPTYERLTRQTLETQMELSPQGWSISNLPLTQPLFVLWHNSRSLCARLCLTQFPFDDPRSWPGRPQ
ncbi:hypothetical protein PHPALM_27781 [Phytophthora palmivora]|uniref:Uncharacterized protein n=1 Tax=Phytophthora palmivora TaxID=4796 RepID=A0A2P4XBS7_9STRA|nr:hypothetical protein PHPALM_27781 [Phytophthora palmivora]